MSLEFSVHYLTLAMYIIVRVGVQGIKEMDSDGSLTMSIEIADSHSTPFTKSRITGKKLSLCHGQFDHHSPKSLTGPLDHEKG